MRHTVVKSQFDNVFGLFIRINHENLQFKEHITVYCGYSQIVDYSVNWNI